MQGPQERRLGGPHLTPVETIISPFSPQQGHQRILRDTGFCVLPGSYIQGMWPLSAGNLSLSEGARLRSHALGKARPLLPDFQHSRVLIGCYREEGAGPTLCLHFPTPSEVPLSRALDHREERLKGSSNKCSHLMKFCFYLQGRVK